MCEPFWAALSDFGPSVSEGEDWEEDWERGGDASDSDACSRMRMAPRFAGLRWLSWAHNLCAKSQLSARREGVGLALVRESRRGTARRAALMLA